MAWRAMGSTLTIVLLQDTQVINQWGNPFSPSVRPDVQYITPGCISTECELFYTTRGLLSRTAILPLEEKENKSHRLLLCASQLLFPPTQTQTHIQT